MIEANIQTQTTVEQVEKPQVFTTSQLLNDLDNGLDRKAIAAKYGLNMTEVKVLFEHPALKGKRPKRALKKVSFTLIDDTQTVEDSSQLRVDVEADKVQDNVSENYDGEQVESNPFAEIKD